MAGVGDEHQPDRKRNVNERVDQQTRRRAEPKHHGAAHRWTEKNAKLARRGVKPDRARQIVAADDIVNQQNLRRRPKHPAMP